MLEEIYGPTVDHQENTNVYEYDETPKNRSWAGALPVKQGLYDPENEKDACGVGFAAYVIPVPESSPHLTALQPHQGRSEP